MSDDYIGPGEGWREVSARDVRGDQRTLIVTDSYLAERPDVRRYWVREAPVPPRRVCIDVYWAGPGPQHHTPFYVARWRRGDGELVLYPTQEGTPRIHVSLSALRYFLVEPVV